MPYIEFLNVTIPPELFGYALCLVLGFITALLYSLRDIKKLKKEVDRKVTIYNNGLLNLFSEVILEVGIKTGYNVKKFLLQLEGMKKPA